MNFDDLSKLLDEINTFRTLSKEEVQAIEKEI